MNLNGEASKNKGTILNGKPLYGYDSSKKMRYRNHVIKHRPMIQRWRKDPNVLHKNHMVTIIIFIGVIVICFLIAFVLKKG